MTVGDSLRAQAGTITTFNQMLEAVATAFDQFEEPQPEAPPSADETTPASKKK